MIHSSPAKAVDKGGVSVYCRKCGNRDETLFGYKNGKPYCRLCCDFNGKKAHISKNIKPKQVISNLTYSLSPLQKNAAQKALEETNSIYINAICGAGKTEIVFASIEEALAKGMRVGFAIPRREVVIEIYKRLCEVYPSLHIVCVYGGHSEYLDGDIVVLTCHQCYRYPNKFGLLILDEYDAFPLKGNQTLINLVEKTSYKKIIYLSATFSKEELFNKQTADVRRRYHGYDLIIPQVIIKPIFILYLSLLSYIKKHSATPLFIYVPTIKIGKRLTKLLKLFNKNVVLFHSKVKDKTQILDNVKNGKNKLVVTTTILERGITVRNLNVCVWKANHRIFDAPTLIQIDGRVGRKFDAPKGQVTFFACRTSSSIDECVSSLVNKNNAII